MRKCGLTALVILCFMGQAAVAGNEKTIGTKDLRKLVSGKTIHMRLGIGVELPITYRANGTMVGNIKKTLVAALAASGPRTDSGRWWIADGQLCQTWSQWMEGRTFCYRLRRSGSKVQWKRNDGRSGTVRLGG